MKIHRTFLTQHQDAISVARGDIKMKIAIIHDWLVTYAGAERVLEEMLKCFPDADLFSLVDFIPKEDRGFVMDKPVTTSFIQSLPFAHKKYRNYLPLMPLAVEQFDLSNYDLIISSSHAVAKGVLTGPDQLHICMCYSPIRYAWDLQHQYLREANLESGVKGWLTKWLLHRIRIWDLRTANGVDNFIAISKFIARRIHKVYRRDSTVIYPPVYVDRYTLHEEKEDFYITASRMVPYKKIDLIVEAFSSMPERKLVVIGDGPDFDKVREKAGPNVQFLGYQSDKVLRDYLQRAKAFIFAAEEDFGIAPLEAQACGTPVIAFGKGGALETIIGDVDIEKRSQLTGIFFDEQTKESLCKAVEEFEKCQSEILPSVCRANAMRFSPERFRTEFSSLVQQALNRFNSSL